MAGPAQSGSDLTARQVRTGSRRLCPYPLALVPGPRPETQSFSRAQGLALSGRRVFATRADPTSQDERQCPVTGSAARPCVPTRVREVVRWRCFVRSNVVCRQDR